MEKIDPDSGILTTLGGPKVFARGRGTRAATTSLLNTKSAALDNLTLQTLLGSVGLFRSHHLDESEATRFLGVRVDHDRAVLDITVLLEKTRNVRLGQTRVDASDEEIGASVGGAFFIFKRLTGLGRSARQEIFDVSLLGSHQILGTWRDSRSCDIPVIDATIGRAATGAVGARLIARRSAAVAREARLVYRDRKMMDQYCYGCFRGDAESLM
jgi:hypothetical protein